MTFVGAGSAKITLKLHWAVKPASQCPNNSLAASRPIMAARTIASLSTCKTDGEHNYGLLMEVFQPISSPLKPK